MITEGKPSRQKFRSFPAPKDDITVRVMKISAAPLPALIGAGEPPPVFETGRQGRSDFVILVDHASRAIPKCLGTLGLDAADLERHIAWDIGSLAVARRLAASLDAPLVAQNYSRLVIDCNRDPQVASSIPTIGEYSPIPGNIGIDESQAEARRREIFAPYHRHIRELLDEREAAGKRTILIALHSMTDLFKGARRLMHAAVMYNRDARFALATRDALRREDGLVVADNEPYFMSDATDYTLPRHGEDRGLAHVALEIRQDLVRTEAGQIDWARRVETALTLAAADIC
jgi:predicted N-formylglutamate amidohydrolase